MGFFDKIKEGLAKTRDALSDSLGSVFTGFSEIDDDFYDELEESLILADLGVDTACKAVERLRKSVRENHLKTTEDARTALKEILVDMLNVGDTALNLSTTPSVVLVIGVNGVGKSHIKMLLFYKLLHHFNMGGTTIGIDICSIRIIVNDICLSTQSIKHTLSYRRSTSV